MDKKKEESIIPKRGFISVALSLCACIFLIIYNLSTNQFDFAHMIFEIVTILVLIICFTLGIYGIYKEKFFLERISALIFIAFIVAKSIYNFVYNINELAFLFEPHTFISLVPGILLVPTSIYMLIFAIKFNIKKEATQEHIAIGSFIARLLIAANLAFEIFNISLTASDAFNLYGFKIETMVKVVGVLFVVFNELGEHLCFDYVGDLADRDNKHYRLTKKGSLMMVFTFAFLGLNLILNSNWLGSIDTSINETIILIVMIVLSSLLSISILLFYLFKNKISKKVNNPMIAQAITNSPLTVSIALLIMNIVFVGYAITENDLFATNYPSTIIIYIIGYVSSPIICAIFYYLVNLMMDRDDKRYSNSSAHEQ